MDTNALLRSWGYANRSDIDFGEVARYAASLEGVTKTELRDILKDRYGSAPAKLEMTVRRSPLSVVGRVGIDVDFQTLDQMSTVLRIPVANSGSLMPDAHLGYAMPIGGVALLENAVSPSFVGYDIACRMTVTILDAPPSEVYDNREELFDIMKSVSSFGLGSGFDKYEIRDHKVMEDPLWDELKVVGDLKDKAHTQLGSSGGGNHFFDLMLGESFVETLPRTFAAIMTHSGSRGTGHNLATHYQKVAIDYTHSIATGIPKGYEWLSLDTDQGLEYWRVMQLMGKYAQANHHLIHKLFLDKSGFMSGGTYENHHNFAWVYGDERNLSDPRGKMIVHRKGATPAAEGQIGIIPGTSGTYSYIVEGLGEEISLMSSSHGAGRQMSRSQAKKVFSFEDFEKHMREWDILFSGVGLDEVPNAYKDIERVIDLQAGFLVRVLGRMRPIAVIMGGKSDDGD